MKFLSTIFLVFSLAVFGYAAFRWNSSEAKVRGEKAAQKELASTSIDLAKTNDWKTTAFQPARIGSHEVILETKSGRVPANSQLSYHGLVEVEVGTPDGRIVYHSPAARISHTLATGLTWTLLGEFDTLNVSGNWTLRVRTLRGDPTFAGTASRVYAKTPAAFDARWYQQRSRIAVALIAAGGVVVLLISGFFYLVARRRPIA